MWHKLRLSDHFDQILFIASSFISYILFQPSLDQSRKSRKSRMKMIEKIRPLLFADSCSKSGVVVEDVISTLDFVNCQRVKGQVRLVGRTVSAASLILGVFFECGVVSAFISVPCPTRTVVVWLEIGMLSACWSGQPDERF